MNCSGEMASIESARADGCPSEPVAPCGKTIDDDDDDASSVICAAHAASDAACSLSCPRDLAYCWRRYSFSSAGSMWNELRTTIGVCMCCHVTYAVVVVFHSEKSSRYWLIPSESLPRRLASDGGLAITVISEKASVTCCAACGPTLRTWPRIASGTIPPVARCTRQPCTSKSELADEPPTMTTSGDGCSVFFQTCSTWHSLVTMTCSITDDISWSTPPSKPMSARLTLAVPTHVSVPSDVYTECVCPEMLTAQFFWRSCSRLSRPAQMWPSSSKRTSCGSPRTSAESSESAAAVGARICTRDGGGVSAGGGSEASGVESDAP